jgi:Alpha/beta hydrolase domain
LQASFPSPLQKPSAFRRAIHGSIEERYRTQQAYLSAFKRAASDLAAQRFLLTDDANSLVKTAESEGVRNAP